MPETYNLYNLEAPFEEYLVAGNQKAVSIKNYLSDVRHFFGWLILYFKSHKIQIESEATITQFITAKVISEYRSYLSESNIPHKTINRRLSTIRKFCSFCISQGWMKENPAKQVLNIGGLKEVISIKAIESPNKSFISKIEERISKITSKTKVKEIPTTPPAKLPLQYYMGFVIIFIFIAVMGAGIYNQFFVTNNQSLAYPTALTRSGRILSFQGRLTDTLSNPITTATNVQFRLWKVSSGGTEGTCTSLGGEDCLYKTGTCSVTPDQDGIFSTLIGSDCGSEIAASVFTENPNVYLGITVGGDAEMTPRQQIANVGYAINSETLQGLPPGTGTSVIPYINLDGNLLISASSPGIRSTSSSTDFTLSSAKATIIQSAGTGDVIIQATESGTLIFRTGGDTGANTRITVDNNGLVGIGTPTPGQALDIVGNLQFSGALMPGASAGTTGQFLISSGTGVAPTWTSTVAATSVSFTNITSGTNTTAAMIVGSGATLDYTGTGTINASSLIGNTWTAPGTIGSITPNTGAFTTLTSSGNTTLATGTTTTNTFGSGASSINTIGSSTTPGALTLHGATTLDNTFTVSGSNLTSLGGNLTVSGTAWTATPTISGLITATSGLTANGALTANSVFTLGDNGDLGSINTSDWDISTTGVLTGISGITTDGGYTQSGTTANTFTGTSTFSNGTYSALFTGGNVGIGTATPGEKLSVSGNLDVTGYWRNGVGGPSGANLIPVAADAWSSKTSFWTPHQWTGGTTTISIVDAAGTGSVPTGKVHEFNTTVGNGYIIDQFIPINSNTTYYGQVWAARTSGTSLFYAGYVAYDKDKNALSGNGGTRGYFIAAGTSPSATGTWYYGKIQGEGTNNNQFPVGTRYIKSLILVNYNVGGIMQVGGFEISDRPFQQNSGTYDLATLGSSRFYIDTTGNVGVGTTAPDARLEINHATGDNLRLTYNDADGTATNYTDFSLSSTGDLTLDSSGGDVNVAANDSLSLLAGTGSLNIAGYSGTGNAASITSSSTTNLNKGLNISQTGATTGTDYGSYVTNTGAGTTNVGGYFSASGATNNYAAIFDAGNVGIGTTTPAATSLLDLTSTTKGFLAPRMTTAQRDAISTPATGLMIYNTTTNQYNVYNGTSWGAVGGGGAGAWSDLTDPTANLALTMGAYTSTFTYNAATGANNLFNLTDTLNNTGTGYLLNLTTASGSTLKPFHVSAAGTEALTVIANGNVGIGTTSPTSKLSVGASSEFQVNSTGNIVKLNNVTTSFPSSQGAANSLLVNNGSGTLTWGTIGASSITADSLDFTEFQDTLDLDANLILNQGTNTWVQNYTGTTSDGFTYNTNSLTSGKGMTLSSTSTALTTGGLLSLDWSPGSSTTATGDLLSLNIGTNGNIGNIFNVKDTGSSLFSVSETAVTSNLPTSFTSAGDVSMAYDLLFTNPTASYIKSTAPLYLQAGETFNSSDLTLKTYNSGDVVIDSPGGVTLNQAQAWDLADSSTTSLNIESGLMNFDTTNSRIGIGTTGPTTILNIDDNAATGTGLKVTGGGNGGSLATFVRDVGADTTVGISGSGGDAQMYFTTTGNTFSLGTDSTSFKISDNSVLGTNDRLTIDSNGNVGIGTTVPVGLLHLAKDSTYNSEGTNALKITDAGLTTVGAVIGADTAIGGFYIQSLDPGTSYTTRSLLFNPNGGNVGIGTTGPDRKLDILDASSPQLRLTQADGTVYADFQINSSGDLVVGVDGTTNQLVLDNGGNLGIGTATPSYKLDVAGVAGANYFVDNDNANYGLDPAGTGNFGGYSLKTSGGALLAYDTGKVGIGNQTPVGKLDVSGYVTGKALTILNETGNQALLTASASGVTKFTVNHDGSITLAGQTSAPTNLNGGPLVSGTIYYSNTTITGGLTGVTAPTNTGATTGDLFLYGEDSAWHRIALDMTQYSSSAANIENTGYIEIAHNQNTNDLSLTGWFKDTISGLWKTVSGWASTIINNLGNQFNPEYTQKQKVTTVSLKPQENGYGSGTDGSITVSSNASINTTSLISGRTCADGGDAVNYSVTGLTSTTATLESAPSTGCLAVGDEVLIINLRGTYTTMDNTGNWETLYVQSIASNIVTFTAAKTKYYGDGASDDTNVGLGTTAQTVMLQRVPNYTTVTVNASINFYPDAWVSPTGVVNNGAGEGGVMFFRATGAVAVNGTIHATGLGYIGGAAIGGDGDGVGGPGGESFCGVGGAGIGNGTGNPGAAGGGGMNAPGGFGYCGGGGGSSNSTGGVGSVSRGGSGGGGGGHAAGGGGGYGTGGTGGGANLGATGGTNSSGNGGSGGNTGGGGGGGTYGDANLTDLFFGASGGAGGAWYGGNTSGAGGRGGGIVYITANSVTVSGTVASNGNIGGYGNCPASGYDGGGGGGAGGSIKIVGNTLNLGATKVTASGGGQAYGCQNGSGGYYYGGAGGVGRVAAFYGSTISGSSAPAYTSGTFTSSPTTTNTVEEGNITRNVNYYEDEDETDVTKITKLNLGMENNMYAETNITQADLTNFDFITAWVYAGAAGNTVKLGFGENDATEHEILFDIKSASTWQKVYWDISHIPSHERDAVRVLRVSGSANLYVDNITAARFFNTSTGSNVTSTPNNYFQYRVILASVNPGYNPTLHNIQLDWNNGFKIEQTNLNKARLYNFTGATQQLRLDAIVFGADLAEYYSVDDPSIGPADAVAMTGDLDQYGVPILRKASSISDPQLAGIISTKAGLTLGIEGEDRRLLALAGRVPVKVDPTSPSIAAGDLLTSSSLPGYARKAKFGDKTIGKALTPWTVSNGEAQVLTLVGNSIALPDIKDATDTIVTKVETTTKAVSYQVITKSGEIIENAAVYSKVVIGTIQSGLIKTIDLVAENITVTQKITSPIADIGTLNVSEKIRSPIIETTDLVASGTAKINEIKPVDRDITFNLDIPDQSSSSGQFSVEQAENVTKGHLSKIIIKGLQGKTVTTIDSEGNASFAGQIIADSLTINNDATVSGNFASNTLTVNDASVSGKLIAKEIESDSIDQITNQLTNQVTNINDIQKLLADIKNQPIPNLTNETNLSNITDVRAIHESPLQDLTVTGNSNLYNVSVSNSLLVGTTLVDQNSIISLASELKLSALSTINLFDGAVMIAKDGKITTRGEIIAQGGIRTNEIKALIDEGQVTINNLAVNNIAVVDRYLEATTSASIIAAADNFDINGIFAPAIETATASAGIAILPEDSNEIVIYNNYVKKDSLIYLTPTSLTYPVTLTVGQKQECVQQLNNETIEQCKKYFTVVTNTQTSLPVKFNWLIIN